MSQIKLWLMWDNWTLEPSLSQNFSYQVSKLWGSEPASSQQVAPPRWSDMSQLSDWQLAKLVYLWWNSGQVYPVLSSWITDQIRQGVFFDHPQWQAVKQALARGARLAVISSLGQRHHTNDINHLWAVMRWAKENLVNRLDLHLIWDPVAAGDPQLQVDYHKVISYLDKFLLGRVVSTVGAYYAYAEDEMVWQVAADAWLRAGQPLADPPAWGEEYFAPPQVQPAAQAYERVWLASDWSDQFLNQALVYLARQNERVFSLTERTPAVPYFYSYSQNDQPRLIQQAAWSASRQIWVGSSLLANLIPRYFLPQVSQVIELPATVKQDLNLLQSGLQAVEQTFGQEAVVCLQVPMLDRRYQASQLQIWYQWLKSHHQQISQLIVSPGVYGRDQFSYRLNEWPIWLWR